MLFAVHIIAKVNHTSLSENAPSNAIVITIMQLISSISKSQGHISPSEYSCTYQLQPQLMIMHFHHYDVANFTSSLNKWALHIMGSVYISPRLFVIY